MDKSQCELANSFPWEIVTVVGSRQSVNRLDFYDRHGSIIRSEHITADAIYSIIYDPVHNRLLFVDSNDDTAKSSIFSFEILTRKIQCLVRNTSYITDLTYDPATESLFWIEQMKNMYSISLKPGFNNSIKEKHFILSDEPCFIEAIDVDSCGGFLYWFSHNRNQHTRLCKRVRFDGSEKKVVTDYDFYSDFTIDQQTQTMYWFNNHLEVKSATLNGNHLSTMNIPPNNNIQLSTGLLTASKDSLYFLANLEWKVSTSIMKIPKNPPSDIRVKPKHFIENGYISAIAANYTIEDQTRGLENCEGLKRLLPNNSVSNDPLNVATDVRLLEDRCERTQGNSDEECEECNSDEEDCNDSDHSDNSDEESCCSEEDCSDCYESDEELKCSHVSAHCHHRLQDLAFFIWCLPLHTGAFVSIYLFIQLVYSRYWWMGILYAAWFITDIDICNVGGRPLRWVRNWTWWRSLTDYFPIKLVKTVDLDPSKNYMFACFPHGVISLAVFHSLFTNATNFHKHFPGMTSRLIIGTVHFLVPFYRDIALALGMCSYSDQSVHHLLDTKEYKGNCACMIFGHKEPFNYHPKEYEVRLKHKRFVRDAIMSGAALVPVLAFGLAELLSPPNNPENSLVRWFQDKVHQYTGISLKFPKAVVIVVVGAPMKVNRNLEPTSEEVNAVHAEFVERVKTLFETKKVKYLKNHEEAKLIIT